VNDANDTITRRSLLGSALGAAVLASALDAQAPHPAALLGVRAESPPQLEKTSVVTVILLTVVSLGLYYPIWFLRRKSALNTLRSSEKLGSAMPAVVLLIYVAELVLGFLDAARQNYGSPLNPNVFESVIEFGILAAAVLLLILAFKVRRILGDHLTASHTGLFAQSLALQQGSSFSGVATFFFGIFYLQYKINEFAEVWSQPPPSAAQEAIPAI